MTEPIATEASRWNRAYARYMRFSIKLVMIFYHFVHLLIEFISLLVLFWHFQVEVCMLMAEDIFIPLFEMGYSMTKEVIRMREELMQRCPPM